MLTTVLSLIQSELDGNTSAKDYAEKTNIQHSIPPEERASTYKVSRIDTAPGAIKHYEKAATANRRQISALANDFLAKNGYTWNGKPRKR